MLISVIRCIESAERCTELFQSVWACEGPFLISRRHRRGPFLARLFQRGKSRKCRTGDPWRGRSRRRHASLPQSRPGAFRPTRLAEPPSRPDEVFVLPSSRPLFLYFLGSHRERNPGIAAPAIPSIRRKATGPSAVMLRS